MVGSDGRGPGATSPGGVPAWPAPPNDDGPTTVQPGSTRPFLTSNRVVLYVLAVLAALVTVWDFSDGYGSMLGLLLMIPFWVLVLVVWLGTIIGDIDRDETLTVRDLVAWALVPLLFVGVVVVSSGPALDLRFRLSVAELDALADRIVAEEAIVGRPTAGAFTIDYHWADGRAVFLSIGSAGLLDDIMLVRDGGAGGCTERRELDDRWILCYVEM